MMMTTLSQRLRLPLDQLVAQMADPGFVLLHRRAPVLRELNGHVSPSLLGLASPRSSYVRKWRRHARRCPICGQAFRYFGLSLN